MAVIHHASFEQFTHGPIIDYESPHFPNPNKLSRTARIRKNLTRTVVALFVAFPPASMVEAIQFELQPTQVVEFYNQEPDRTANRNSWCFTISGAGNDMTDDIFDGLPSLPKYCNRARVIYSNAGIDGDEISRRIVNHVHEHADPDKPISVALIGGSMGGLVSLEVLSKNIDREDIDVKAVLLDSTPPNTLTTKGFAQAAAVSIGSGLNKVSYIDGYKKPLNLAFELASRANNGNFPDITDIDETTTYFKEANRIAQGTESRLQRARFEKINDFETSVDLSQIRKIGIYVAFLHADDPDNDKTVDVVAAGSRWKELLPGVVDMPVPGGGHANPNETPAYDAIVERALRESGMTTIEERSRFDRLVHAPFVN